VSWSRCMAGGRRRAIATVGGRVWNRRRRDRVAREFRVASATTKFMQPVDRDEEQCDPNRCEFLTWVLWTMPMCDATGREWGAVAFGGSVVPAVVDRCTGQRRPWPATAATPRSDCGRASRVDHLPHCFIEASRLGLDLRLALGLQTKHVPGC
jgi:hypothetical protein